MKVTFPGYAPGEPLKTSASCMVQEMHERREGAKGQVAFKNTRNESR